MEARQRVAEVSRPTTAVTIAGHAVDVSPPPTAITSPSTQGQRPAGTPSFLEAPIRVVVARRLRILVTLLVLQSMSQLVLQRFEGLVATNMVIPLFLTMIVGAGGNAGNQAAVAAITGLTSGALGARDAVRTLRRELLIGLWCAGAIGVIGFVRVLVFYVAEEVQPAPVITTVLSLSMSLVIIVLLSVVLGAALPFALRYVGANVEHAAPIIQVLMDILGVTICCVVCAAFLPSSPAPAAGQGLVPSAVAAGGSTARPSDDSAGPDGFVQG